MQVVEAEDHKVLLTVWKTDPAGACDSEFLVNWKQIEALAANHLAIIGNVNGEVIMTFYFFRPSKVILSM